MKVSELGEFNLIKEIKDLVNKKQGRSAKIDAGIGDDAAAVEAPAARKLLLSTDTMVENVHFNKAYATGEDIGYKAMTANISDIAAMAGVPEYALVTLGLKKTTDIEFIKDVYRGLLDAAWSHKILIVGGDLTKSATMFITVALTGKVEESMIRLRSGAEPGQAIMVTGNLGASGAALKLLKAGGRPGHEIPEEIIERHLRPSPRIIEARLAAANGARAMQDISDGLVADLRHICEASKVGAKIYLDRLPIFPEAKRLPSITSREAVRLALTGGEDYELIITAPIGKYRKIKAEVEAKTNTDITLIGEITGKVGRVEIIEPNGRQFKQRRAGYDHFG